MSTVKANTYQDASGGNTATINSMTPTADSLQGFRNRIINGDMRIDQRNAGAASANTINGYWLDRWNVSQSTTGKLIAQQNAGSVTPPAGFSNYLGITSQSAYTVGTTDYFRIYQPIEGYNMADLAWGSASAKTVTLSFWVRSSLTGTFGGALQNSAFDRSYPFSYTISSANTWEYKTITAVGDTSGTWTSVTNGVGMYVFFGLGVGSTYSGTAGAWAGANYLSATGATSVVGTNSATFYITGVQLEVGSTATPFERRDYGRELIMCQRYLPCLDSGTGGYVSAIGYTYATNSNILNFFLPVSARVPPTGITTSGTLTMYNGTNSGQTASTFTINVGGITTAECLTTQASGFTAGQPCRLEAINAKILFTGCEL